MGDQVKKIQYNFRTVVFVLTTITVLLQACATTKNTGSSATMSGRQRFLKSFYPVWMWLGKLGGVNNTKLSNKKVTPPVSFYSLKSTLNDGAEFDFATLKGKKVLLVNTASDCGYTGQYEDLQKLYSENKDQLVIIGYPANDFKEQEKGTDEQIARFCKLNYGVTFPLMQKSVVIKGKDQNDVFKWLTDPSENGWNSKPPSWNFSKYLVDENGSLINYFGPSVSPSGKVIERAVKKKSS
jgi:glutathione peroxidase